MYIIVFPFAIFQALFSTYGIDWDGPPPMDVDSEVVVPEISCPLSPSDMAELQAQYNPLDPNDDFAVTTYLNVLQFTMRRLT